MMKKNKPKLMAINLRIILAVFLLLLYMPGLSAEQAPESLKPQNPDSLLTLDLKDVDLKDALKIISQASGLNMVMDNDVKATVTIALKDVDWQTALDNILKTNELTYKFDENIIRIMTLDTVKKEIETLPLATTVITLNFAKASDLQQSLSKMLSSRGNIQTNVNTNSLIVTDTPEALDKIEDLAHRLDVRTPQVLIEALIMSVKLTDTDKFGLDFTATHKQRPERKIIQSLQAPSTALDLSYGKTIFPLWNLSIDALSLFAEDKRVDILANPRVLTLDNLPAQIEILEQVAYTFTSTSTEGSSTVSSTQFKDVGIKLYVTPHITKDKFISLMVKAEQSFVAAFVGADNQPSIDSRKVDTNFMLKDGESVVIGGLRKKDNTTTVTKVPLLGDIPFLGKLFSKEVKEIVNTELLIFITPHVMEDSLMTVREEDKLDKSLKELTPKLTLKERVSLRERAISNALNNLTFSSLKETR